MASIYVFHHGSGMNGELWYSVFDLDSSTWSPDRQVPNVGLSGSPSAVVYPGRGIYVFHQGIANYSGPFDRAGPVSARRGGITSRGELQDGQLWYSFFDGTNWHPDTVLPNVGISEEPSAVVYPGGGMSVFHRGDDVQGTLWYSNFDGTNWYPDTQVPNVRLTYSPSAVVFPDGGVSVFHEGNANDEQLWYSFFDGTNWQPDTQVPNVGMSYGPSAVVFPDGSVSVFHQGSNNSEQLWYSFFDGANSTWQRDTFVPNVGLSTWPGAVILPDGRSITVFHDGSEDSQQLWYSFFDGANSTWQPDTLVPNVGISYGPSAVIF
jgi:hypothetical protein